jgi:hypothetical protein
MKEAQPLTASQKEKIRREYSKYLALLNFYSALGTAAWVGLYSLPHKLGQVLLTVQQVQEQQPLAQTAER